jgi:hypothetical protein
MHDKMAFTCCYKSDKIMTDKEIKAIDEEITEIRIELAKGVDKEKLDLMLYNLQISVFKLEDE